MKNKEFLFYFEVKEKNGNKINNYYIGREQVTSWMTPSGAAVLLPNREAVMKIMKEALQGKSN